MTSLDEVTAQDVIDALRFAMAAQEDEREALRLVDTLLNLAPGTDSNHGVDLMLELVNEGRLQVAMA